MIIVTGGAGFIGSAIVAGLNKRGIDDIVIVDILASNEKWKNLRRLRFADYVEADDFLEMLAGGKISWPVEVIFHLGACSDTTERDASYMIRNNYDFSKILANRAVREGIRFIYASSAATYGDGSQGFSDSEAEIDKLKPLNIYAYSKQMFDLWARRAGLLKKIVGLKYFNVFGPNEYHKGEMRSFVLKAYEQINAAGKVRLFKSHRPDYADGEQKRDFIYIKDAVDMTLFFLDNPKTGGIFNIGTGAARSWNDLAGATFAAMDKKVRIDYIPMPEKIRDRYQYFTQADITKLKTAGYKKQTTPLEDAIKDYVQNYLQKNEYLGK
ncbi:MAG TPA: ADP-glyceromanno-heptose 6-epimerase [Planctomycetes bacterium]|nr:ADP-glyceromanno-heptose 6-epimerase [Planctomycetota bacterium]